MVTTLFFLLMVKHFVCDFALQGRFKQKDKHLLTSTKGHMHALDHALGTALVFLFVASFAFAQGKTIFVTVLLFPIFVYYFSKHYELTLAAILPASQQASESVSIYK